MKTGTMSEISLAFKSSLVGLLFAVMTILYGQAIGIVFGLNEDSIKDQLKSSAIEVRDTVYQGDDAAIKVVLDKSWTYMKRAHLHAGAMGTSAVVLIILNVLLGITRRLKGVLSIALGVGGFGYSLFWMWAGFRAPTLGGTGAAKESLKWLAMPSSGAFVAATILTLLLLGNALLRCTERAPKIDSLGEK